jgi:hypothetical protein
MEPTPRLVNAADELARLLDGILSPAPGTPARLLSRRLQLLAQARREYDMARREYDQVRAKSGR